MDKIVRVRELNAALERAREAYYQQASPIMSDAEYDHLEKELRDLCGTDRKLLSLAPVLAFVGSDLTDKSTRIKHKISMLSIENLYEEEEVVDWCGKFPIGTDVSLEPKFDGISVSLIYWTGNLRRALTRGDGESGEDITAQVRACKTIPQVLKLPLSVEIRGELVMKNSTLERINKELLAQGKKPYSSTRNLAAGTMKLSDLSEVTKREIELRPWDVQSDDSSPVIFTGYYDLPDSAQERLELLQNMGFSEPRITVMKSEDRKGILNVLRRKLEERESVLRSKLSLETDGVVIKVDSHQLRKKLGVASKYTNYQVCFKPQSASATTILKDVTWQVGRQGKLTPVAEVEAVVLAGANVQRANLNNITWIRGMGLKIGAKIEILRSGDVIPIVTRVIDDTDATEIEVPENCPECNNKLIAWNDPTSEITTHWCRNIHCPGRLRDYFTFVANRDNLEIDSLGPEMASLIVSNTYAHDLAQLFEMGNDFRDVLATNDKKTEKFLIEHGFSIANLRKMLTSMEKAKTADWDRWIASLGISMIGRSLGKIIAKTLQLGPNDIDSLPAKLTNFPKDVEGIGERKLTELHNWAKEVSSSRICKALYDAGVRPTAVGGVVQVKGDLMLTGLTFVITGEFEENRDTITTKLEGLGAKSQSGVSKKTQLLIVGSAPGKSKLTKAQELGVKKVGVEFLIDVFGKAGITFDAGDFEVAEQD